ncbi:MAG: tRNA lysidine(34) synthetase TilS [Vulcanimicrobiota bacterium]
MNKTFYEKVLRTIRRFSMLQGHEKVIVAVSGGPDSAALLTFLAALRKKLSLRLFCIHVNHGLRGTESDEDARLVAEYAASLDIPVRILNCSAAAYASRHHLSIEHAGRTLRYSLLKKHARDLGATRVATAHHLDDQAETVLMRIIRGAGVSGIYGIHPVREGLFIRPFIEVTRREITAYVKDHHIPYRTDSTNEQCLYFRNSVRHRLMPLMLEYNPSVKERLWSLSQIFHDDDMLLRAVTEKYFRRCCTVRGKSVNIDTESAVALPMALKRRLMRKAFESLQGHLLEIDFSHVERLVELMESPVGTRISLVNAVNARKTYGALVITSEDAVPSQVKAPPGEALLNMPGQTVLDEWNITVTASMETRKEYSLSFPLSCQEALLDADKVEMPLLVRARRDGDRFSPIGVKGTKKVKDFFIEVKIEQEKRNHVPLIVDGKGRIVWIAGYRIDERFKVTDETEYLLHLKIDNLV